METIELVNDGSGLGFGIIGGKATGVIVKTILPGGVADQVSSCDRQVFFCSRRSGASSFRLSAKRRKTRSTTNLSFHRIDLQIFSETWERILENGYGSYLKYSYGQCTKHPEDPGAELG